MALNPPALVTEVKRFYRAGVVFAVRAAHVQAPLRGRADAFRSLGEKALCRWNAGLGTPASRGGPLAGLGGGDCYQRRPRSPQRMTTKAAALNPAAVAATAVRPPDTHNQPPVRAPAMRPSPAAASSPAIIVAR